MHASHPAGFIRALPNPAEPQPLVRPIRYSLGIVVSRKLSKKVYGDPNEYMWIFNANRDKLQDPDKIQAGQQLVIPKP